MSKIKNPDKYIQVLKRRVETLEENNDILRKRCLDAEGKSWFTYEDGVTKGVRFTDVETSKRCHLGKKVSLIGYVEKLVIEEGEASASFRIKDVRTL